ncbi:MAG: NAD(P)/FAD-dependent oxidoreductase [Pseudomonadales bacterium]|nr:NAD(P)/FAD-dependent oxidoreductase [Pseudomonadales bacterium]
MEHLDVLIVGAGISGIGAGYHLKDKCPGRTWAILERRDNIGGTWDLFKYPGIRSDSDMYTLGYAFKPWTNPKAIADGPSILEYLKETAQEYGIDQRIRFGYHVKRASWSSAASRWTVEAEYKDGSVMKLTCNFLFMCSGYYNYDAGYTPEFEGTEDFRGRIVHPQKWTEDIDYAGKQVVVIGSGATAVTLVPEMAKDAAHVTMLQRSPTYVVSRPGEDAMASKLSGLLGQRLASSLVRWRNILFGLYFFRVARKKPERVKKMILDMVRNELPEHDVETHFTPRYNPWDQRMCLVPDGDLFTSLREGKASVVTDHIERFTPGGILLKSGKEIPADLIVTATGLEMQLMSDLAITVDGRSVAPSSCLSYKAMMFSDIPNIATSFGYTNASWTLKADLTCKYVCRLLNYMEEHGYTQCCPRVHGEDVETEPFIDFSSGYVQRAVERFPRQGTKAPWKVYQNYLLDKVALGYASVDDGVMEFSSPASITSSELETA